MSTDDGLGGPPELVRAVRDSGLPVTGSPRTVGTRDLEAEVRAAREGVALRWSHDRAPFAVTGADRVGFLHRMLTREIQGAGQGDRRRALLLDQKGRIVADLDLGFESERILGVTAPEVVDDTFERLRRFVLRDDIRFESMRPGSVVLWLVGPATGEVLEAAGLRIAPEAGLAAVRLGDVDARILRTPRVRSGLELVLPADAAAAAWELLLEAGSAQGIEPLGDAAVEVLRIEAGIPAHGTELTASEFPQEARLDAAVDHDKGCYLGQETVARIHYRGKVNRLLSGLRAEIPLEPRAELLVGGREVGSVTSCARRPGGDWVALGYVRTEHGDPGTRLDLADEEGAVEVRSVDWWSRSEEAAPASTS